MRWVLHLFVAMAVLLCGLHIGETDAAHAATGHHQLSLHEGSADHDDASPETGGKRADTCHSHCPIALDPVGAADLSGAMPDMILAARPPVALHSLVQAPPIEPPLA